MTHVLVVLIAYELANKVVALTSSAMEFPSHEAAERAGRQLISKWDQGQFRVTYEIISKE